MRQPYAVKVASLALVLLAGVRGYAGDYGLFVKDGLLQDCTAAADSRLNACDTWAVANELRKHHLSGAAFQHTAVRLAFQSCRVTFWSSREQGAIFGALAQIASEEDVTDERTLLDAIHCFPFKSMRAALAAVKGSGPRSTKRLAKAMAAAQEREGP